MLTVGIDLIELDRIGHAVERWGTRFLRRVYTARELEYCRGRIAQLAARFAAKEAVMKALGTGVQGVGWRDVEIIRKRGKAPSIALHGRAVVQAKRLGLSQIHISISHSRRYAVASVVGEIHEDRYH